MPSNEDLLNDFAEIDATTAATGTSTSSSRLRRLDKLVIDQSSLLDEDDQIEYINQLNTYNITNIANTSPVFTLHKL